MDDFPTGALPWELSGYSAAIQDEAQAPAAMAGAAILTTSSAANQRVACVELPNRQYAPLGQFAAVIGNGGFGKTEVNRRVLKPIYKFLEEIDEEWRLDNKERESQREFIDMEIKVKRSEIYQCIKEGKDPSLHKVELKRLRDSYPKEIPRPRLLSSDATPESNAYQLSQQPWLYINSGEASGVLNGRAVAGLPHICDAWSGVDITVDRKTEESYDAKDPNLAMFLMIQDLPFEKFLKNNKAVGPGFGFFERTEVCRPKSLMGERKIEAQSEVSRWEMWKMWYERRMEKILYEGWTMHKNNSPKKVITFDTEATKTWLEYSNWIEGELRVGGKYEHMPGFATKTPNNIARRAANMSYFLNGDTVVTDKMLRRSIEVSEYYLAEHSRIFHAPKSADIVEMYCDVLWRWLVDQYQTKNVEAFKLTDLYRLGPSMLRLRDDMEVAINELVKQEKILDFRRARPAHITLNFNS